MSVSIQSCPSCRTLLLSDTAQCPLCQHVVNPDAVIDFGGDLPEAVAVEDKSDGVECADCGELVRPELVRCWRCGAFLRPEIAKRYQEMQQKNASPVMYSQEPHVDGQVEDNPGGAGQQSAAGVEGDMSVLAEGDFELADGVQMSDGADFELDDELLKNTESVTQSSGPGAGEADAESPVESDDVFSLKREAQEDGVGESPDEDDTSASEGDTSHPVAASGDALLDIAMKEEAESDSRRRHGSSSVTRGGARATARTGFIVFCPNGHPIEVQERHRGRSGKCPKCQSPFLVPQQNWDPGEAKVEKPEEHSEAEKDRLYTMWLDDVHLHQVDPGALKLKTGSLAKAFLAVDLGFSADNILVIKLVKSGGLFGGGSAKKVPEIREQVRSHLEDVRSSDGMPAAEFVSLTSETLVDVKVVQPAPYAHESMFAGVDVFGEGRIAVRLPDDPESKTMDFLSLSLSEFRKMSRELESLFGISSFGADVGVPLVDTLSDVTCHYNDEVTMTVVDDVTYYAADEAYKVTQVGCRCDGCGLIVCEDSRKKEKIGGKSGKGLAKAVCPKCKRRFGDNPLFEIQLLQGDEAEDEGSPDTEDDEGASGRGDETPVDGEGVSQADGAAEPSAGGDDEAGDDEAGDE